MEIQNSSQRKYKFVSISEKTYNRLGKYGHWSESADQLINRILDERDDKEVSEHSAVRMKDDFESRRNGCKL